MAQHGIDRVLIKTKLRDVEIREDRLKFNMEFKVKNNGSLLSHLIINVQELDKEAAEGLSFIVDALLESDVEEDFCLDLENKVYLTRTSDGYLMIQFQGDSKLWFNRETSIILRDKIIKVIDDFEKGQVREY